MTRAEKKAIIDWAEKLSDCELEAEYYTAAYDCLGSLVEEMYERGYDIRDIQEQEKYEKLILEKANILEITCTARGIKLWGESI